MGAGGAPLDAAADTNLARNLAASPRVAWERGDLHDLERLRTELGRLRLPHRSFMPELRRSMQHRALR